jgi:four helix bundle protein
VKSFEDLDIWKQARQLVQEIYRLTKTEKFSRDFDLRHQIQGATVSIMSNIAEGFERGGNQEFIQFLYIAKGSCGEVRSQTLCRSRPRLPARTSITRDDHIVSPSLRHDR